MCRPLVPALPRLKQLAHGLGNCGVVQVAMEDTGVLDAGV